MELLGDLFSILLHLDEHLIRFADAYGGWIYLLLFLIIFCETGLVITPFLPGDSLLFVAGAIAASGAMEVWTLALLLIVAAFSGDNTNYWIGRFVGPKVFRGERSRFLNPVYLEKTQAFYERHGGKTIIFARFLPIVRTFAPFVAGIGRMLYPRFMSYSLIGSISWIGSLVAAGYFFGNVPIVKNNLTIFILLIIFISILPGIIAWIRRKTD